MPDVAEARRIFDPETLIRPTVRAVPTYAREAPPAAAPARVVRLDWNESPYGPSPKARAAVAAFAAFHRYPEIDARSLREALAQYLNAAVDQVVVGAGLDDVFQTLAALLIEPGDRVLISEPTFGLYRTLFSLHGAEVVDVPLTTGFDLDVGTILAAIDQRTKLVVVCNPNNPTGNVFDRSLVERLAAEAPCLVAIDEAYAEFAGIAHLPLMDRHPNVAVFRTLSKFAGLAGMRVGYGVLPATLAPFVPAVMPAFGNVSAVAAAAAIASLDDLDYLEGIVARIVADRDRLVDALRRLRGVEPLPSATNFLLVRLPLPSALPVVRRLAEQGVHVRSFPRSTTGLSNTLRVTIGTPEENAIFLAELTDALGEITG